ncbi:MAG: FN3 associated domain-containing protein, partial [Verrucomicrobiales bacterium]
GYYDERITLELTSDTPEVLIRYSDNGKEPSLFTGKTYSQPITIDKTTTIRARAERNGFITSKVKTHTYIFVNDVIQQDTLSKKVTEDAVYGPLMRDALLEYPAISLVTPDTDISKTSEDPTSVEMIFPDGSDGFQIDAGVKRVGGHSLNAYPKNNMRLYFRSEYGQEKLSFPLFENSLYTDEAADSFDQLNLRGGSHDSLFYLGASSPPQAPSNGQYLRNRWINDMQFVMGHESLRGRWVHLYINGIYWGHYQ